MSIREAIAEFKSQNGEFKSGEAYCVCGYNEYDEAVECEIPVYSDSENPDEEIASMWEDFVSDHNADYCFDDREAIIGVREIRK